MPAGRAMPALRAPRSPMRRDLATAALAGLGTIAVAFAASRKLGDAGIVAPLALILVVALLRRPVVCVAGVTAIVIVCEGPTFGVLTFTSHVYAQAYKDISVLDLLVIVAVLSVLIDVLAHRRPFVVPRALVIPLVFLACAMVAGMILGHAAGNSLRFSFFSENVLSYLFWLPIAVANLDLDRRSIKMLLAGAFALAIVKAVLGLVEVAGGFGSPIEGTTTLTYYEPTANWLIMVASLAVLAFALARSGRIPRWILWGMPLLVACLVLSYRRSFWVAALLGIVLLLLIASTATGRRLLVPGGLVIAAAVWVLGSTHVQNQSPIIKRAESLAPSRLEMNVEDSYRLDERANVLAEIAEHPITGLGMAVPWKADARTLSVEHEGGREYVHFALLWYWLKLGVLGLCAYVGIILASLWLAFRSWRVNRDPWLRAFALASMCSIVGLVVIETTASFTGIEARFTVLLAVQIGLLSLLSRPTARESSPAPRSSSDPEPAGGLASPSREAPHPA